LFKLIKPAGLKGYTHSLLILSIPEAPVNRCKQAQTLMVNQLQLSSTPKHLRKQQQSYKHEAPLKHPLNNGCKPAVYVHLSACGCLIALLQVKVNATGCK